MMGWMKANEYPAVWTYEELEMSYAQQDGNAALSLKGLKTNSFVVDKKIAICCLNNV
jgi:hypothetical protein